MRITEIHETKTTGTITGCCRKIHHRVVIDVPIEIDPCRHFFVFSVCGSIHAEGKGYATIGYFLGRLNEVSGPIVHQTAVDAINCRQTPVERKKTSCITAGLAVKPDIFLCVDLVPGVACPEGQGKYVINIPNPLAVGCEGIAFGLSGI